MRVQGVRVAWGTGLGIQDLPEAPWDIASTYNGAYSRPYSWGNLHKLS